MYFDGNAEMDSPISIVKEHPYGRRRGKNVRAWAELPLKMNMYSCSFIENQMYKLNFIDLIKGLIFTEK